MPHPLSPVLHRRMIAGAALAALLAGTGRRRSRVAHPGAVGGPDVLVRALRKVTDDMIQRDDRVLSCMGTGTASGVPRATQLDCIRKAWEQEFGQRS